MISLFALLLSPALAGAPVAATNVQTFAGVPVSALPALSLGEPEFIDGTDTWRAPAPGGWVLHAWSADAAEGARSFRFTASTVQRMLPTTTVSGADEAVGGDQLVIARRGNVVVQVKGDHARDTAAAILAAEAVDPGTAVAVPALDPVTPRDGFGRRLK